MRLKFQKVPALLLSAAMALTPATGVWATDASQTSTAQESDVIESGAYVWFTQDGEFVWDENDPLKAQVYYYLKQVDTEKTEKFGPYDVTIPATAVIPATCEHSDQYRFTYKVELKDANGNVLETHPLYSAFFTKKNGTLAEHKWSSWEKVEGESIDPTCDATGKLVEKRTCSVCKEVELKETSISQYAHETTDQNGNFTGYTDRVYLAGYENFVNIIPEKGDEDGFREAEVGVPQQDRPELDYSYDKVYRCRYCDWEKIVPVNESATAVLESEPEIDIKSIENLYYVVSYDDDYTNDGLTTYPVSLDKKDVEYDNDGELTGRVFGQSAMTSVNGKYDKGYLVDCTKDGSYWIVRYKLNSDGSYLLDSNGDREIARYVEKVVVPSDHQMSNPTVTEKYRCTTTEGFDKKGNWVINAAATTCTDGWYTTYSKCLNPNCKHEEKVEKISVKKDLNLHQYPDKWELVLDTQNCENYGKQFYKKVCTLCDDETPGHVMTREEDHSEELKDESKSHKYDLSYWYWVTTPTCTKPGVRHNVEYCSNKWYAEDGTQYTCNDQREMNVVVEALGHDTYDYYIATDGLTVADGIVVNGGRYFNTTTQAWEDIPVLVEKGEYVYNEDAYRFANFKVEVRCNRCAEFEAQRDVKKIEVVKIVDEKVDPKDGLVKPGEITLKATFSINGGKDQTQVETFPYYSSMEVFEGKGHEWSLVSETVTPATCTKVGEKIVTRTCKLCGTEEILYRGEIPMIDHVAGEPTVDETTGDIVISCEVCGAELDRTPAPVVADPVADFVDRMYDTVLNRLSDDQAAYWAQTLKDGSQTGAGIAVAFFTSSEYAGRNKTDSEYLNDLYVALMGRNADASGKTYWQGILNMGYTRNYVLEKFIGSPEFKGICEEYGIKAGAYTSTEAADVKMKNVTGFVTRLYETTVGRTPDPSGLDYWIRGLVNGKVTGTEAVVHFCNSAEFQSKNLSDTEFVTLLYNAVMGRKAEADGVEYWVGQLAKGATRTSVVESFAKSPEFGRICESYGITR